MPAGSRGSHRYVLPARDRPLPPPPRPVAYRIYGGFDADVLLGTWRRDVAPGEWVWVPGASAEPVTTPPRWEPCGST